MSMADRDGKIWKDGQMIEWRDATLHMLTHSLHYGMAIFEGVRAYKTVDGTAIFRLKEHTQRLFNSAKIFQMKLPFDIETLMAAQREVVRANHLESCYIRPLAWIGSEKTGRLRAWQHDSRLHRRLALGRLSGRRRTCQGHTRQNLIIYPSSCERIDGASEGQWLLHQLDSRESGSHR